MTDVVIPLSTGSRWADNELRFALRSVYRYAPDLGRIIVVGHCPDWLDTTAVLHLPAEDRRPGCKDVRIIRKVLLACEHVSGPFVRMSDDEAVLRETAFGTLPPYGQVLGIPAQVPKGTWQRRHLNTQTWLHEHGYGCANFDLHCPMLVDPDVFRRMAAEAPWEDTPGGMCINTLYGNYARLEPVPFAGEVVYMRNQVKCHRAFMYRLRGARFLNYNNRPVRCKPFQYSMAALFPEPGPWELADHGMTFDTREWTGPRQQEKAPIALKQPGPRDRSRLRSQRRLLRLGSARRRKLRARKAAPC